MIKFAILGLLYFCATILKGQNIEIGQDANETFDIIESLTFEHNKVQHNADKNTYWYLDYISHREKINEILQCYCNEYVSGLGNISYYCSHYIFRDERLAFISTLFTDIDSVMINKYLQDNFGKYKIGQYYFSSDYNYYSVINGRQDGFVAVDWLRAEWDDLSPEMQDTINNRLLEKREMTQVNLAAVDTIRQRENEIKSRMYDLQIHDSAAFNLFISELRKSLIDGLKNNSIFPGWEEIANESEKFFVFKNSYNALYRIYDQSKMRTDSRYRFIPDDGVFSDQSHFELVHGNDTACDFLAYYSPTLPSIRKEGYNVMTDARVTGIDLFYTKGITRVKIKDGKVTYRKYNPPPEVRISISQDIKNLENGLYKIKYESGVVMDSAFTITEPIKMSTVGGTIFTVIGLAIMTVVIYAVDPPE